MANIRAAQTGNWSATSTWIGGVVPVAGDNASSNTFTVTIDVDATCDNVTNGTTYGGTSGGGFTLSNGVTLTANVIGGASASCVSIGGTNSASIVGNISISTISNNTIGVNCNSTGILTITGVNITAAGASNSPAVQNSGSGSINITASGTISGGSNSSTNYGVNNNSTGLVTITGNVTSGSAAAGVNNNSTGTVTIVGTITGGVVPSFTSSNAGATNRLSGSFIHSSTGVVPIYALKFILNTTPTAAKTRYALNGAGTYVDMFTADNSLGQAIPADVRLGIIYASGSLTGTLAVPPVGSVAAGVPVDATVGTATLTASDVRAAIGLASANLDTQLAAIPTASQNATQVRTELTQELTEITETHLIHGLKTGSPLNVTPTTRTAGAISQTITGDGVTTTTVTR